MSGPVSCRYAELSTDGTSLVSTGIPAGEAIPRSLARHVRIDAESAREKALTVREAFEMDAYGGPFESVFRGARSTTTGDVVGITLIIDFSDDTWTIAASANRRLLQQDRLHGLQQQRLGSRLLLRRLGGAPDLHQLRPAAYYRAANTKAYYCSTSVGTASAPAS